VGAETRILLLSNRDQQDLPDEPPLGPQWSLQGTSAAAPAISTSPALAPRPDSVAPAAADVLAALARTPGVRVAHRTVFHPSEVLAALGEHRPTVVFNLCEALGGDSRLEVHAAWLLERLGVPFTGSPYHALRHCLYKIEAHNLLARAGVSVPATVRVDSPDRVPRVSFPAIVKPEREDGSTGIEHDAVVYEVRSLRDRVAAVIETHRQPAVVQHYIHGREISVSLLGTAVSLGGTAMPPANMGDTPMPPAAINTPRVLSPSEIVFGGLPEGHPPIVTFSSKWDPGVSTFTGITSVPAVLRPPELRRVAALARRAFEVLGLRDYGRVDMRLDARGVPYVIDVNPNCDLSEDAGFSRAARRTGLSYPGLIWQILQRAMERRSDASVIFGSRGRSPRRPRASALRRDGASVSQVGGPGTSPASPRAASAFPAGAPEAP
jgi:D-alanine-D-alanine ligase